jgi:hypothetical protein
MIRKIISAAALVASFSSGAFARDPIGETAAYQLDKSSSRTTGMIQSGSAKTKVVEFLPDHENGPSYNVSLDYDFVVQFYGRQQGTAKWEFAQEFFQPGFMEKLRQTGSYETADYKIRHEGFADARTMDGGVYAHCDKILIYDIKVPEAKFLETMIYAVAGYNPNAVANPPIEDLKIRGLIYAGVPVLEAVKLDLSGIVHGVNAKAGFDYRR